MVALGFNFFCCFSEKLTAGSCWLVSGMQSVGWFQVGSMVQGGEGGGDRGMPALQAAQYTLFARLFAMRAAGFGPLKG